MEGPEFIPVTLFTRVKISIGRVYTFLGLSGRFAQVFALDTDILK
jgi:hypothetical protein